jgi:hypothetical protein
LKRSACFLAEQTIAFPITIDQSNHDELNRMALGSVDGGQWTTLLRERRLRNLDPDWHGSMLVFLSDWYWASVPYNTACIFLVEANSSHHPKNNKPITLSTQTIGFASRETHERHLHYPSSKTHALTRCPRPTTTAV